MGKIRILILGGTTEARKLAQALSPRRRYKVLLSLAGRTENPSVQPVPVRIGGFGGVEGLGSFLREGKFDLLIDATHPFAARISANAAMAARIADVSVFALRRAEWAPQPGDLWIPATSIPEAIAALGPSPRRVFLATGRQEAHYAEAAPQHFYLVRSVDPVVPEITVPDVHYILDRGPFDLKNEIALLKEHRIEAIIAKNSGGSATYAKIEAARHLGIEVIIVARAPAAGMVTVDTVDAALLAIDHLFPPDMKRGV
jgi:precorrin-6A/cobalt-precorrin-6A reductase